MPEAKKPAPKKDALEARVAALEEKIEKLGNRPDFSEVGETLHTFEDRLRAWLLTAPLMKVGGIIVAILLLIWIL